MASNSFGQMFRITTWGESHGKAIGVVIDGCPAGLSLDETDINKELARRAPGRSHLTSPRKEADKAEILSGVFDGVTTGAPISILIPNKDADSSKYESIKHLMRPGHANFTYIEKYGVFDYRGGGRSSARETACRVAAGAVAKKLLEYFNIDLVAYMKQIGQVECPTFSPPVKKIRTLILKSPLFCPEKTSEQKMIEAVEQALSAGDSLGGIVEFHIEGLTSGLGDPVYEKLEACLAKAMMSLPATKGFEIGEGFKAAQATGTTHNDLFTTTEKGITTQTNHSGGTLGGISTGQPVIGRVAFKPTSSIKNAQQTVDDKGNEATFILPEGSRHDPCVAIRAVPVVEAMAALTITDALLLNRCARL